MFRSKLQKLQRPQAQKIADSIYPGSRVIKYHESDPTQGPVVLATEGYKKTKKKKEPTKAGSDEMVTDTGTASMSAFNSYGEETSLAQAKRNIGRDPKKKTKVCLWSTIFNGINFRR